MLIISYIRNEADIVEEFVRHHARLATAITIVVRPSEDGTEVILQHLRAEGLPLTIIPDASPEFRQVEAMQEALSSARKMQPDWILPLDADEFLTCDIDLHTALAQLPSDRITLLPWRTYVPTLKDNWQEPSVLHRIQHRRDREVRPFSKALIPAQLFDGALLQTGNHTVRDRITQKEIPSQGSTHLALAHFPVRSSEQIQRKIHSGWTGLAKQASANQGYHWRDLYEKFAMHPPTKANLTEIALRYALQQQDPTPGFIDDPVR